MNDTHLKSHKASNFYNFLRNLSSISNSAAQIADFFFTNFFFMQLFFGNPATSDRKKRVQSTKQQKNTK